MLLNNQTKDNSNQNMRSSLFPSKLLESQDLESISLMNATDQVYSYLPN